MSASGSADHMPTSPSGAIFSPSQLTLLHVNPSSNSSTPPSSLLGSPIDSPTPTSSPSPFSSSQSASASSETSSDEEGENNTNKSRGTDKNTNIAVSQCAVNGNTNTLRFRAHNNESAGVGAPSQSHLPPQPFPFRPRTVSFPARLPCKPPHPHQIRSNRPRVLVTGGAGFIGSHVARALLERGEEIVIVDELNDYYQPALKLANLQELIQAYGQSRVKIYICDVCNQSAMSRLYETEKFDRIIHLAARAGVRPSIADPLLYEHSNVRGTLVLLELAKRSKGAITHFVYASSSSVYGDDAPIPFKEDDPCNTPVSPYAATKKACELLASTYAHLHGIPCSGMRFFTVYGENGRRDMAPFLFTDKLARGEPIVQFGDGTSMRDFTYIADIVDGVLRVLDHVPGEFVLPEDAPASDRSLAQVYNLGVGEPIALADFIQLIARELQVSPNIIVSPRQPGDVERTYADISKARRLIGYEPKVSVQEGIKRLVKWYKSAVQSEEAIPSAELDSLTLKSVTSASHAAVTGGRATAVSARAILRPVPVSTTFPPLAHSVCATRIHNGSSSRVGLSPDVFAHLLTWVPRALACTQFVAIAVDTTGGKRDIIDAVRHVIDGFAAADRTRIHVIGVSPWQSFVPALNALLGFAIEKGCQTILYSSLEMQMHPAHVHTLKQHLHADTLVVGARLSGHRFVRGSAVIDGCSTIWNTLALWDVRRLARTGFLAVSDGLPAPTAQVDGDESNSALSQPVAGGVEEVVCVSLQQQLFPTDSKSKLLSMASTATHDSLPAHHTGNESQSSRDADQHSSASSVASPTAAPDLDATTAATTSGNSASDGDDESNNEEQSSKQQQQQQNDQLLYDSNLPIQSSTPSVPPTLVSPTSASSSSSSSSSSGFTPCHSHIRSNRTVSAPLAILACGGGRRPSASSLCRRSNNTSENQFASSSALKEAIPSLFWDANFGGDVERAQAHEKKMRSKIERAQQQLDFMRLQPGTVEHIHVTLPSAC